MSQIPTPPPSRGPSIEPDDKKIEQITTTKLDEKVQLLDELLERYLHLLDTHQKLQKFLGKQLSSGFFQLAHANYVSPGRRFGEDFYDERMKATRRLNISSLPADEHTDSDKTESGTDKVHFKVTYKSVIDKNNDAEEEKADIATKDGEKSATDPVADPGHQEDTKQDTPVSGIATPQLETNDPASDNDARKKDEEVDSTKTEKSTKQEKKIFRSDDPISWYGILVPSSLRNAQRSFIGAVDGGIPEIVTVIYEMRCMENSIYDLRREIEGRAD